MFLLDAMTRPHPACHRPDRRVWKPAGRRRAL